MARRKTRPSPTESATLWEVGKEKIGGDGATWHVSADTRGIKRWKKGYSDRGTERRGSALHYRRIG